MDYGHYVAHAKDIDSRQWREIKAAVVELMRNLPDHSESAGGYHRDQPLAEALVGFDKSLLGFSIPEKVVHHDATLGDAIIFNGLQTTFHGINLEGDEFCLEPDDPDNALVTQFNTHRKPYDLVVCAVLIVTDYLAPGCKAIDSKGGVDEWWPALEWVRQTLFPEAALPDSVDPERVSGPPNRPTPMELFQSEPATSLYF